MLVSKAIIKTTDGRSFEFKFLSPLDTLRFKHLAKSSNDDIEIGCIGAIWTPGAIAKRRCGC